MKINFDDVREAQPSDECPHPIARAFNDVRMEEDGSILRLVICGDCGACSYNWPLLRLVEAPS